MVAKTQFAITGEDTRYFLNGALFVLRPDSMSLVATDGHRLALVTCTRDGKRDKASRRSQGDSAEENARRTGTSARGGDGDIAYERGENHLFFDVGGRLLISRMIDGQFPAYERVIPKGNDKHIEFERDRLTNAVKRVALLSNERSRAVKFQIDKGKVDVTSSSPELGEAHETLPVDYSGAPMQICFNAQYVLDFLAGRHDRRRVARPEGRSQPGRDETGRRRRLRLHLRDHADAGLTCWTVDRPRYSTAGLVADLQRS